DGPVTGVSLNADGTKAVTIGADKTLKVWSLAAPKAGAKDEPSLAVKLPSSAQSVAFNPTGARIAVNFTDKTVNGILVLDAVSAVAFSRDFTQVGAAAGKVAKTWNLADAKELLTLTHPANVTSLSFSVDKAKVVTGSDDNLVRVWDVATGKELESFTRGGAVR